MSDEKKTDDVKETEKESRTYYALIAAVVILAIVAVFAAINGDRVEVNLLWISKPKPSLALLIFVSVALGMIIMAMINYPRRKRILLEVKQLKAALRAVGKQTDVKPKAKK